MANQEIYKKLNSGFKTTYCNSYGEGVGGDISKEIDLIAERIFVDKLSPFGKIISEEGGDIGEGEAIIWLDPIDGSDNIISQIPYYGSSVALEIDRDVKVGVVCNFANGDIFVKSDSEFKVAKLDRLEFSDVVKNSCSSVGIFERAYLSKIYAKRLHKKKIKYRMPGAIALSLAYGHYVDFVIFEDKLREFDIKAGMKMCENLYKYQYNDLTLICKDEDKFLHYKKILLEDM